MTVPRLDGGDELPAILEAAELDLAGPAIALRVVLVAETEMRALPGIGAGAAEEIHSLVAGGQEVHLSLVFKIHCLEVVHDVQALIDDFRNPAIPSWVIG